MFTLKFETDNAAFDDEHAPDYAKRYELARILADVTQRVIDGHDSGTVRDINGNAVGTWKLT